LRFAKLGGYDRIKFADHHRAVAKNKMAIANGGEGEKLLINHIVHSSLNSWW
jgi:hypothetical protein